MNVSAAVCNTPSMSDASRGSLPPLNLAASQRVWTAGCVDSRGDFRDDGGQTRPSPASVLLSVVVVVVVVDDSNDVVVKS